MNTLKVFADFHNADVKGRVRLNCAGTIADLKRQGIELRDGQPLIIYSEELEVEGVVRYSEEEKLWTAVIDWDAIREVQPIASQTRNSGHQPHGGEKIEQTVATLPK